MRDKFTFANIVKAILALATIFGVGAQGFVAQGDASLASDKADRAYDLLRTVVVDQGERIQELERLLMRASVEMEATAAVRAAADLPKNLEE